MRSPVEKGAVRPGRGCPALPPEWVGGEDAGMFLGEDLLAWLVLAVGGAMAVGNGLALFRPPEDKRNDVIYIIVGLVAAVWGLATLLA